MWKPTSRSSSTITRRSSLAIIAAGRTSPGRPAAPRPALPLRDARAPCAALRDFDSKRTALLGGELDTLLAYAPMLVVLLVGGAGSWLELECMVVAVAVRPANDCEHISFAWLECYVAEITLLLPATFTTRSHRGITRQARAQSLLWPTSDPTGASTAVSSH
jgi:hypothetical protein